MSNPADPANSSGASRRSFFKTAGAIAGGVAATTVGCESPGPPRDTRPQGFNRTVLDPLAEVVLPSTLGADGRRAAVDAFVKWANDYEPVAQEMLGYGYSDIRYLPADPAPGWRAQLDALSVLAHKLRGARFSELDLAARRDVVAAALANERSERLPGPLNARHIAVALLAHWADTPAAWNLALGVDVSPGACRPLDQATRKPLPVAELRA
jgi:hypothetical protein